MNTKSNILRLIFGSLLLFVIVSCNSVPSEEEPTISSEIDNPTPINVGEAQHEPPPSTAQIPEAPVVAPTVDLHNTNINLKQELYFTGGAERGDDLSSCERGLFEKYEVSDENERGFVIDGIAPPELKEIQVSPFLFSWTGIAALPEVWTDNNDTKLYLCIYGFPEDEIATVELYTPENELCASWDIHISDYYYLKVGDVTIVDFVTEWPRCSHAGQWSIAVKSTSVSITDSIEIDWHQMAQLSVSNFCDSSDNYISVKGVGYPFGETRILGVYGNCFWGDSDRGYVYTCELLASHIIDIDETGKFDVLLPAYSLGEYIVVPIMKEEPPNYGGHEMWFVTPGIAYYQGNCDSNRDLHLTTPTLKGDDVEEVQQCLQSLGYFEVGPVDGEFGPKTESAVLLFEQTNGLESDGIVDEATRSTLFGDDAVPRPHPRSLTVTTPRINGDDITLVQQRLKDLGYVEVGEIDGYYGPKIESAILRFQQLNGLPETGIVDQPTWEALFSPDAVSGW